MPSKKNSFLQDSWPTDLTQKRRQCNIIPFKHILCRIRLRLVVEAAGDLRDLTLEILGSQIERETDHWSFRRKLCL